MIPLQSKPMASRQYTRQRRQRRTGRFIAVGVLLALLILAGASFAMQKLFISHAASDDDYKNSSTTINGLQKISQVGSTANILDANGNKVTVDPNPYKIAIAPSDTSDGLNAGDVLVSNIGNVDKGVTIVKFTGQKTGVLFNKMNDGVLGPAGLAFDNGKLLVANSTGNSVLVFNPNGTLFATIKDPLFNGPWGITTGKLTNDGEHRAIFTFFTANKFDAKILRVDVISQYEDAPTFKVTQVGQFDKNGALTKIDLHWFPKLKIGDYTWKDVLLAVDPANNRIAAFVDSSDKNSMGKGITVFKGTPLNMPGGMGINPLNGDLLVVNLMDNNLVELNLVTGKVVGVKQIDPVKVDNQGNGSALFGVVAIKDWRGNLKVFFTDDNTNTLDALSAS